MSRLGIPQPNCSICAPGQSLVTIAAEAHCPNRISVTQRLANGCGGFDIPKTCDTVAVVSPDERGSSVWTKSGRNDGIVRHNWPTALPIPSGQQSADLVAEQGIWARQFVGARK